MRIKRIAIIGLLLAMIPTSISAEDKLSTSAGVSAYCLDMIRESYIELEKEKIELQANSFKAEEEPTVNEDDVELLAHLLMAECGSDWCSDDLIYYCGSVVLNRVNSDRFPNSLHEVIYQKNQYQCVKNGHINKEPTDRCYDIATDLLQHGSILPSKVIWQAEFMQGHGIYTKEQNMYFCY